MSLSPLDFYTSLFHDLDEGEFIHLRAFDKETGGIDSDWFPTAEEAQEAAAWFDGQGTFDTYFAVNAHRQYNRGKESVTRIRLLHADMDFKKFSGMEEARHVLEEFELPPTWVVESGGGYHLYWLLDAPLEPTPGNIASAESLMQRLYHRLGDLDKVQDVSRILRCPGTTNQKYEPSRGVTIDEKLSTPTARYALQVFDSVLPPLPEKSARASRKSAPPMSPEEPQHADSRHLDVAASGQYDLPTEEEVRSMLAAIPPEGWDYDDYYRILMAVQSVFPDERAVRLIQEWSPSLNAKYQDITASKLASFKRSGITIRTLYWFAKRYGWQPPKGGPKMVTTRDVHGLKQRTTKAGESGGELVIRGMDEIVSRDIEWLWEGWLARGMVHLLGGHPGDGKSTLTADIAATLSHGGTWPDGTQAPRGETLFLLAEDPLDTVAVPRLRRHNADEGMVKFIEAVRESSGKERFFSLGNHLEELEGTIVAQDIALLVIDPLSAFMTGARRNDEGDVRDLLQPLVKLAEKTGVAVLCVMHVGKSNDQQRRASQQLLGSTAFVGLARVVLMVAPLTQNPQEARRVVGVAKTNIGRRPPVYSWDIGGGVVTWHEAVDANIEDLLRGGGTRPASSRRDEVSEYITGLLLQRGGVMPAQELDTLVDAAGYSQATYRRARKNLHLENWRGRGAKAAPWFWGLPGTQSRGVDNLLTSPDNLPTPYTHNLSNMSFPDSSGVNTSCSSEQVEQLVPSAVEGQLAHPHTPMSNLSFPDGESESATPNRQLAQAAQVSNEERDGGEQVVPLERHRSWKTPDGRRWLTISARLTPEEAMAELLAEDTWDEDIEWADVA